VFWARPDGRLAVLAYPRISPPGSALPTPAPPIVAFTKATGSATQLAAELQGRNAEPTIQGRVNRLVEALEEWQYRHGRYPPRAALLPGGAFWKWKGAPHLTNAISGGPMVLGDGVGNFDYTTTSGRFYFVLRGHLYGGEEDTRSGGP
jgi:hypothetical protein